MTENYILLSAGTLLLISSNVVPEAAAKAQDYANPLAARLPDPAIAGWGNRRRESPARGPDDRGGGWSFTVVGIGVQRGGRGNHDLAALRFGSNTRASLSIVDHRGFST